MKQVEWFFDFISPYSYLQCECWDRLPAELKVQCRPVLLAGLLDHWGQKGPAEIAPKRIFIYRQLQWLVEKRGIPFRFPNGHPFNPLPMLRLAVALDSDFTAIREMFRFVWRDGHLPSDQQAWSRLLNRLNVTDAETKLQSPIVKQQLRDNGKRAIELGVFGVPTFVVEGELFWGADALDFFLDYLRDPDLLSDPEMKRISNLPIAAARTLKSGR
jgi:2-hydroxychromene-2-carboxylate isomerase